MSLPELLTVAELAQILGTSVQAVRNALHRGMEGVTVPPSIKLGARRRWMRREVYRWLQQKSKPSASSSCPESQSAPSRSSFNQEWNVMNSAIPHIVRGQVYATSEGQRFTVINFDPANGRVLIATPEGRQGVMHLDDMLQALREGEVADVGDGSEPSLTEPRS